MYSKLENFRRNYENTYSKIFFVCMCILLFVLSLVFTVFLQDNRNYLFTYPEETYQDLEQQAQELVELVKNNSNISGDLNFHLKDDESFHCVTLEIKNFGEDIESVKIKRTFSAPVELVLMIIFICFILIPVFFSLIITWLIQIFLFILTNFLGIFFKNKEANDTNQ